MIIFDGLTTAAHKKTRLRQQVAALRATGIGITVAAIVFTEDAGSRLYTRLKKEAAESVGIEYQAYLFSITDPTEQVIAQIDRLNKDQAITGIIIQKPTKHVWQTTQDQRTLGHESAQPKVSYATWWESLTSRLAVTKDVDGLHPTTIAAIAAGTWQEQGRVLPATCQAVLDILQTLPEELTAGKVLIIGKSDLLGTPLYHVLRQQGRAVELLTRVNLSERMKSGQKLLDARVIISATGSMHLVTGEMISDGVVVIDVGEPKPDVDRESVLEKIRFITPVPNGVGPMTIVCLLENAVQLAQRVPS